MAPGQPQVSGWFLPLPFLPNSFLIPQPSLRVSVELALSVVAGLYAVMIVAVAVAVRAWAPPGRENEAFLLFSVPSFFTSGTIAILAWSYAGLPISETFATASWVALQRATWFFMLCWMRLAGIITGSKILHWATTPVGFGIGLLAAAADAALRPITFLQFWGLNFAPHVAAFVVVAILVVVAAFLAWLRAESDSVQRRRAGTYLLAFGVHDLAFLLITFMEILGSSGLISMTALYGWYVAGISGLLFLFLPLVTYAMLTGRVAGVENKFRIGISSTATGAVIAGLFIVVVESVEAIFDIRNTAMSVTAAVGLAFAFRPIQGLTEKAVLRLLPASKASVEDYKRAVESALSDGTITKQEQRVLDDLRARMG